VADAVAASAKYPVIGSNLLSLYAHVFERAMFEAAEGPAQTRCDSPSMLAGDEGTSSWPLNVIGGIYDEAQENVQRFTLPEMVRRAAEQDLADLLARPRWRSFDFPTPFVFNYAQCRPAGPSVGTRLRLKVSERASLDAAVRSCVESKMGQVIAGRLSGETERHHPYRGIFEPSDRATWTTLFRLALSERRWQRTHGQWATIDQVRVGEMQTNHLLEGRYRAKLEFDRALSPEQTGFVFDSEIAGNELRLYATRVRYQDTRWVSLVVTVTAERLEPEPSNRARAPATSCRISQTR
jgi:hypothetical protein